MRLPTLLATLLLLPAMTLPVRAEAPAPATPPARPAFAEPGIAPSGDEIAFVSGGSIWSVPAAGGEARLLVTAAGDPSRPLYAPDGRRLAFASTRSGAQNLYVADLAADTIARVTSDDGADVPDGWSPDGKDLTFDSTIGSVQNDVGVMRVGSRGGTAMPLVKVDLAQRSDGVLSPSGDRVAYRCGGFPQWWRRGHAHIDESAICVRTLGATARDVRVTAGGAVERWPMWHPDGRTIAYVSDRDGSQNLYDVEPGRTPRQLTHFHDGRVLWPSMDAAGKRIAFERNFAIWTLDLATGVAAEVPIALRGLSATVPPAHRSSSGPFEELAVAPDGKKLAFVARGRVFIASTAGDEEARPVSPAGSRASQLAWNPNSLELAYARDRDGTRHIAVYAFPKARETLLTHAAESDDTPAFSPDGKRLAFVRGAREIHVVAASDGGGDVTVARGTLLDGGVFHSEAPLAWAPAGDAIAYLARDPRDFEVLRLTELGGADRELSFIADTNADDVRFSPDGKRVFYVSGQRTEPGSVVEVDLTPRPPRFKEDRLRTLLQEQPPRPGQPETPEQPGSPAPAASTAPSPGASPASKSSPAPKPTPGEHTSVTYDAIAERTTKLPVGLDVQDLRVSKDGTTLLLIATVATQTNLYRFSIDELADDAEVAVALTSSATMKSYAQYGDDRTAYYLDRGRITAVGLADMRARPLAITAPLDSDFDRDKMQEFAEAWQTLDEFFDDPKFDGVDWKAVRSDYEPLVRGARSAAEVRRLLDLMIGELDASHSGIYPPRGTALPPSHGRLGVAFDAGVYERTSRLRILQTYTNGPAALAGLKPGDDLVDVNGVRIERETNLDDVLDNTVGKRVVVGYERAGVRHDVAVLPIPVFAEGPLHQRDWIAERRAIVDRASGGRLGYAYLPDMDEASLAQFVLDLDTRTQSKEGVVVDVRDNHGGFVDPYVIDILTRHDYLLGKERGDPATVPMRAPLGQRLVGRKSVLVTDEHSLSDAEDLSAGFRALHVGPIVGKPTAGWIIFTSNVQLFDGTTLRVPQVRITTTAGEPLELHPRPVDVDVDQPLDPPPGTDTQLEAAVKALLR